MLVQWIKVNGYYVKGCTFNTHSFILSFTSVMTHGRKKHTPNNNILQVTYKVQIPIGM